MITKYKLPVEGKKYIFNCRRCSAKANKHTPVKRVFYFVRPYGKRLTKKYSTFQCSACGLLIERKVREKIIIFKQKLQTI